MTKAAKMDFPRPVEESQRRCIVSGVVDNKEHLLRFVIGPDGQVVPDIDERLPGRGIWLRARRKTLEMACSKRLFSKASRSNVVVPGDIADRVERLLLGRCLNIIGLARRAGQAVSGYEKVSAWLRAGRGGILIAAVDGAPAGRAKLRAVRPDLPVVELLNASELGATADRERTVHMVIAPGKLASDLRREAARLAGFRYENAEQAGIGLN
jgi:hypothetical protein